MKVSQERIEEVADLLYRKIYETPFGGKARGRFIIDREQMRELLGTSMLREVTLDKLYIACLDTDLIMINLDGVFAFIEADLVRKYRKAPVRVTKEFQCEITPSEHSLDEEDDD
ncbi:hypothetical protein PANTOEA_19740 [Pantoea dispersa]|uniref:hypothetical protein n=1 Tax=Pantoea dispersa TaxID=59814 RepID=UPI0032B60128